MKNMKSTDESPTPPPKRHRNPFEKESPFDILKKLSRCPPDTNVYSPIHPANNDNNNNNNDKDNDGSNIDNNSNIDMGEVYVHETEDDKNSVDPFFDFELKYAALRKRHRNVVGNMLDINLRHRKNRHMIEIDDTLSEITYNSNTNYSKLDWNDTQTQDMVINEVEAESIFHDIQAIPEKDYSLDFTESIDLDSHRSAQSLHESIDHSMFEESGIELQDAQDAQDVQDVQDTLIPEPAPIVPVMTEGKDLNEEIPVIHNDESISVTNDIQNNNDIIIDDGGNISMDHDYDYNDDIYSELVIENEPESPRRRVIQGDSFIRNRIRQTRETPPTNKDSIFPSQSVKNMFAARLGFNKDLSCNNEIFDRITSLFFDQISNDLLAYKEHSGIHKDEIRDEDMLLLMHRQRLIHDKSSIESLAHEHLPREMWDSVCVSAMADNILYPDQKNNNNNSENSLGNIIETHEEEDDD